MKKLLWLFGILVLSIVSCKKDKDEPQSKAVVATTAASAITEQSATTGGSITDDGGSSITQRGIVWALHTEPTLTDTVVTSASATATWTTNLTGLKPNTTYYVRAYATNAQGTAYGNEINFKTSPGLASITTAAVTDNIALSAKSGGEVTNDGGTPVTARGIVYATTPNPTLTNIKIESGSGAGTFAVTIPTASELIYYVRAFATNSAGTAYGNEITFTAANSNSVADVDGNVYSYITINTPGTAQVWMTSNLKVTKYRNGNPITDGSAEDFNWLTARDNGVGAFTYPDRNAVNNNTYGKYYNLPAVRENRGLCPTGWHVPTDDDWKKLEIYLGMTQAQADALNWRGTIGPALMEGGSSGLNLQKAGNLLTGFTSGYYDFNTSGYYWTSTDPAGVGGSPYNFNRGLGVLGGPAQAVYRSYQDGATAMSVRCLKD